MISLLQPSFFQEHAFSPPAQPIEIGYGESKEVVFHATRVAFRGLKPDTTYVIKVARKGKLDSAHIERASPGSLAVKIGYHEDVKDLDFVVFEQPDMTILSGHVEGKNIKEMHSHIRVEIRPASDPSTVVPLPISNFFQVFEIDLERQPQIHVGPLSFRIEEDMYKQELTPAPVYPLVVGLSVIAMFITMPRLKDLYQATVCISFPGSSAAAKKDVKKLGIRKKT